MWAWALALVFYAVLMLVIVALSLVALDNAYMQDRVARQIDAAEDEAWMDAVEHGDVDLLDVMCKR